VVQQRAQLALALLVSTTTKHNLDPRRFHVGKDTPILLSWTLAAPSMTHEKPPYLGKVAAESAETTIVSSILVVDKVVYF
jgi:hypothetical protein